MKKHSEEGNIFSYVLSQPQWELVDVVNQEPDLNLHFLEANPELYGASVLVSEAQPITAVSLLWRKKRDTVWVLAAPPEARDGGVRVTHVLHAGVAPPAVPVPGAGREEGGVAQGGLGGGETEHQDRHEAQLVAQCGRHHHY